MRFGKSAERHAEQIRCKGCNRNMFLPVHNKAVIDLIRKNNQTVFSCQINDLLKYLFWIKSTGRVIRIDDDKSFRAVIDLLFHVADIRIPVGLFIAKIVDGFSAGKCGTGGPKWVIRRRNQNLIPVIQKSRHT